MGGRDNPFSGCGVMPSAPPTLKARDIEETHPRQPLGHRIGSQFPDLAHRFPCRRRRQLLPVVAMQAPSDPPFVGSLRKSRRFCWVLELLLNYVILPCSFIYPHYTHHL